MVDCHRVGVRGLGESTLFVDDRLGLQIANLALQEGLLSREAWAEAIAQQARETAAGKPRRSLCAILLSRGTLTRPQLEELRKKAERKASRSEVPAVPAPPLPATPQAASFGKYLLLRKVGEGGRGEVHEAVDQVLNRRVALKIIRDLPGRDPGLAAREQEWFLAESRVLSSLPLHPSIVPVHETGVVRGARYVAMELVRGLELDRWPGARDRKAQVSLLRDVARALHEAHEAGFVHGDLKPRNILVDGAGRPRITDFGTARSVRQDSRASLEAWSAMVGTALYMSPEQAQGSSSVDRRADVYALGVMLYEALAGRPPFQGDTAFATVYKALRKEPPRPSSLVDPAGPDAVDPAIESICLKAMARKPGNRYATAADLAEDLDAWLSGSRVRLDWPLGRRAFAVLGGTAAVAVLGTVLWSTRTGPSPSPSPSAAPAPAASSLPAPLHLAPGPAASPAGLSLRDHPDVRIEAESWEGRPCWRLQRNAEGFGLLPIDVDEAWSRRAPVVDVEVEFLDEDRPGAYFTVQYDSMEERLFAAGAYKWAGTLWLGGSGAWKIAVFRLPNPRFEGRQSGGSDFRLFAGLADLRVARVALRAVATAEAAAAVPGRFPALSVDASRLRPGLAGEYFSGMAFETPVSRRIDAEIAFDWGESRGPEGLTDRFSVRWSGYLRVPRTGRYLLETQSDNGVRLSIDGRPVILNWNAHASSSDLAVCELEAGFHRIVLEYFEETGSASILFSCLEERDGRMRGLGADSLFHP